MCVLKIENEDIDIFTHILDTEIRLHAPHAGCTACDDERGGDAERFEGVRHTIEAIFSRHARRLEGL
jgi:hypothetical protein